MTSDINQARPLADAGYTMIPLHHWDSKSQDRSGKSREDGKRPRDRDWTKKSYDSKRVMEEAARTGINLGVRLAANHLVIDYDPRNDPTKGKEPNAFSELVLTWGFDPTDWPMVKTGGGGLHAYLSKSEAIAIKGALDDFPGVEFKTKGTQVVAPGSKHPSGGRYEWISDPEELFLGVPEAPSTLVDLIAKPERGESVSVASGEHTPEELEAMLEALNPEDFQDQGDWFQLMQACHHATAGEGREEFVEWSTSDPAYSDDAHRIGVRWDSLDANCLNGVTYKTLYKRLRDIGREDAIPGLLVEPQDDFGDDLEETPAASASSASENPVDALVKEMNETHCGVMHGSKFEVYTLEHDDAFDRYVWVPYSREAFRQFYEDERVPLPDTPKSKYPTKADVWLRSEHRRKYKGIVLDPQKSPKNAHKLNLWQGWAVDPKPGDWSLMRELIDDVLCNGDRAISEYVHKWIAYMLQKPWMSPEAAIVFRGKEGTGKGTLARALLHIAGAHGLPVSSSQQFAGRFNAHLRDVIFLFADEAVAPANKEGNSVLKQLVTEPVISYEGKGKAIVSGRNMVHIMMASNESWVVPAGPEARRYLVSEVSDKRRNDRTFFGRLWKQMGNGGYEAMLHDLMNMELGNWTPSNPPSTSALGEQKVLSLDQLTEFWRERLMQGDLSVIAAGVDDELKWSEECEEPLILETKHKSRILEAASDFIHRYKATSARVSHKGLVQAGRCFGLEVERSRGGKVRQWIFPPLKRARANFEKTYNVPGHFDDEED